MANMICRMEGDCFAKTGKRCQILNSTADYNNRWNPCPFQKKNREVTNGRLYPFNPYYSSK